MGNNWKEMLAKCFEDNQILASSIQEARENFDNFCEFIAEPSFVQLKEELELHKVGAKIQSVKGSSISFQTNFARSSISQFQYTVYLPKNSIHLKLKSRLGGRKNKKGIVEMKEGPFMEGSEPSAVMGISQEDFIHEVIRHYRNFLFNSTVSSE
ncbi:hypothetical protein ACFLQZ_05085 [Acidobacteriota bacterium]